MKFIDSFIDVTKYAKKLPTSEYLDSGKYPIIDQGQKQIAGYTDIEEGLFTDVPAIIFGDHTRVIKYIDTPFFIGADGVKVIKCLDGGADYKYCYYLLKSARIPDTGYNRHFKWLKESVFPEHNKQQQRQIVNTLTAIDELIIQYYAETNKLDELIKSRFVEMFGDPIGNTKGFVTKVLKDVLILKAGDFTAASDISDEPTDKKIYPCYGGNGIRGYVSDYNQEGEYSLVGRQGALSGNVQFAKGKFKNTEHALLVTPLVEMNNLWLNQLLINLDLKRYQTGAAQPGLSVKNLQEIPIVAVPIEEQDCFADFVTQVVKQKATVQQSIDKLETLKKSLMQEYFR